MSCKIISSPDFSVPPSTIKPSKKKDTIAIGDYDMSLRKRPVCELLARAPKVRNVAPSPAHIPIAANRIARYLNILDIVLI